MESWSRGTRVFSNSTSLASGVFVSLELVSPLFNPKCSPVEGLLSLAGLSEFAVRYGMRSTYRRVLPLLLSYSTRMLLEHIMAPSRSVKLVA